MNLTIKALTPDLIDDYFDFFDNRAFSDGSPNYPCYCNAFNMSSEQIKTELFEKGKAYGGEDGWKRALRESAQKMVKNGKIRGYLAYDGELSIGWCNTNDRLNYYRVGTFDLEDVPKDDIPTDCPDKGFVKSIVCFEISPDYRGNGIAGKMLDQICKDATAEGYTFVEAYPNDRNSTDALAFTGPKQLYEKRGFKEFAQKGCTIIMRKTLYSSIM